MSEKWGLSHRNPEKLGHSYTFCWKNGANHIPGSAEKGGYSARTFTLLMDIQAIALANRLLILNAQATAVLNWFKTFVVFLPDIIMVWALNSRLERNRPITQLLDHFTMVGIWNVQAAKFIFCFRVTQSGNMNILLSHDSLAFFSLEACTYWVDPFPVSVE